MDHLFNEDKMDKYQRQLLWFLPILNLICGVTIDLYAPALPQIETFYNISQSLAQNTITSTILGYALGQFIFGFLSDYYGRRKTLIIALIMYLFASFGVIFSHSTGFLLVGRILQGFACGAFAVNSRAIAVDNFTGHDLKIAIIYLSLAWGIGPIISPYIGGVLVTYLPWQSTFYVMFIYALLLLLFTMRLINKTVSKKLSSEQYILAATEMLSDRQFLCRTIILGLCFSQGIIFNLTAPFWVASLFHQPPYVFGQAALLLGIGYFCGTLLNRIIISRFHENKLIGFGLVVGVVFGIALVLGIRFKNIYEVAIMIALVNFGAGFIFANVMASNISKFAKFAGICTALQGSLMLLVGTCISYLISLIKNPSIQMIGLVFLIIVVVQVLLQIITVNLAKK